MYRTIFTRIYLDSRKISWARIFVRIDSQILTEFLALDEQNITGIRFVFSVNFLCVFEITECNDDF